MKKENQIPKNRKLNGENKFPVEENSENGNLNEQKKKMGKQKPVKNISKKALEKKGLIGGFNMDFIEKARQFLRESRIELKKVKWPTKKELIASTSAVIVLALIMALFFGIVDFGLIKIIKSLLG